MESPFKINLGLFIIFLLGFICVILTGINKVLFIDINTLAKHSYSFIWSNLTFLGDALPACAIMLLFIRKRPDLVWSGILSTLIATLIVNLLKFYFNFPRPPAVIDHNLINIIGPAISSHTFPSGHTVTIFTLIGIVMFYFRTLFLRLIIVILALFTGISRIAVGVHWPADVLAGAAIGILCAVTGVYFIKKLGWKSNKPLQLITGFLLIISNLYLLFIYDCRYKEAVYLQSFFAVTVLIIGMREYVLLWKTPKIFIAER
jgi:membrane-associated phospholipid phosphatase